MLALEQFLVINDFKGTKNAETKDHYQAREVTIAKISVVKTPYSVVSGKDQPEELNHQINWNLSDDDVDLSDPPAFNQLKLGLSTTQAPS